MFLYVRNQIQFYLRNRAPKQHAAKVEEIKKQASSTHTHLAQAHIQTHLPPHRYARYLHQLYLIMLDSLDRTDGKIHMPHSRSFYNPLPFKEGCMGGSLTEGPCLSFLVGPLLGL